MWVIDFLLVSFVIILPLFGGLIWYAGKNLKGTRRENNQSQIYRYFRQIVFVWLLMVLLLGQQVLDSHPGSREHRAFWLGFLIASDLFLVAFATYNLISQLHQMKEKRRQQAEEKSLAIVENMDNQPDTELAKVRALLVAGLRIRAVQLYRKQTGESLEASIAAIEQLESRSKFAGSA